MNDAATPFPWAEVMRFCFGTLHLAPADFWSMSLPELNAALASRSGLAREVTTRNWLDAAIRQHPDQKPQI